LRQEGFEAFAEGLLAERRIAGLPPYAFQATLRADDPQRERVLAFLEAASKLWQGPPHSLFGPLPAMMERRSGRLRWYLLLQHEQRPALQALLDEFLPRVRALPEARRVRWAIDLDPQEF
jgi:primosomal protein N' (replication factor Y)